MTNSLNIQVVYFAKLRELTGLDREAFSINKGSNPTDVLASINERHQIDIGSNFKIAVNDEFSDLILLKGGKAVSYTHLTLPTILLV